ncbi:MAG: DUF488 family protein [Bacteroidales bacterium]
MKIYTGNFANVKKYREAGLHPVSIATSARYFTGQCYRPLNPDRSYMMEPEETYIPKYENHLKTLNAVKVVEDLEALSNGNDIVLCCHEGESSFCHRQLVAKWLNQNLGLNVPELGKMQHNNLF